MTIALSARYWNLRSALRKPGMSAAERTAAPAALRWPCPDRAPMLALSPLPDGAQMAEEPLFQREVNGPRVRQHLEVGRVQHARCRGCLAA